MDAEAQALAFLRDYEEDGTIWRQNFRDAMAQVIRLGYVIYDPVTRTHQLTELGRLNGTPAGSV